MKSGKQLIDVEAAKGYVETFMADPILKMAANAVLDSAPRVDAVEVVHGRCEYCKDGKSFIGARMLLGNDGKCHDINNCPNCGAKMDGDGNGMQ